jgi:hypothetical protein
VCHSYICVCFCQQSCKVCNKTFANVYRLQRHMISHDESAVLRKFKCPQCEKAFKFKHHLKVGPPVFVQWAVVCLSLLTARKRHCKSPNVKTNLKDRVSTKELFTFKMMQKTNETYLEL